MRGPSSHPSRWGKKRCLNARKALLVAYQMTKKKKKKKGHGVEILVKVEKKKVQGMQGGFVETTTLWRCEGRRCSGMLHRQETGQREVAAAKTTRV